MYSETLTVANRSPAEALSLRIQRRCAKTKSNCNRPVIFLQAFRIHVDCPHALNERGVSCVKMYKEFDFRQSRRAAEGGLKGVSDSISHPLAAEFETSMKRNICAFRDVTIVLCDGGAAPARK